MHEGDISAGFDETEAVEKSVICNVRGGSESGRRRGHTCV